MRLARHTEVAPFAAEARALLLENEAKHALILGHVGNLERGTVDSSGTYFATLHEDDRTVGAALRISARDLVLTSLGSEAVGLLVRDLHEVGALPGVHAPRETASAFAAAWRARTGDEISLGMRMAIHACTTVVHPERSPRGALRLADEDDLDLVTEWSEAFVIDAGLPPGIDQRQGARKNIAGRRAHLWETDGRPVSMAVATGPTPTGVRIGGVFTPRALRGRGHASACVANLTQQLLDAGRRSCFLYTDLANPTSNAIYRRIGFEPIAEYEEWRFAAAP